MHVADTWIANADGTDQRPLIERAGDERYPSMSPDGTRIAFRGDGRRRPRRLCDSRVEKRHASVHPRTATCE